MALAMAAMLVSGCSDASPDPSGTAAADSPAPPLVAATVAPSIPLGDPADLQFPAVGDGAIGIAHADGSVQVLGRGGDTGTVPIASITKVITSLVVLDAHPLNGRDDQGPTLTLGQADLDVTAEVEAENQFAEPMYSGQQVTLHDALAITLLTSANNYAESVARWAFGSEEAYLAAARTWLTEHGLTQTTLADASGLDPGSASSTADLLRVAALAHANPALLAIAGMSTYDQVDLGTIANQNILLGEGGVDGLKTGSTSYAGFTLLTSAVVPVGSGAVAGSAGSSTPAEVDGSAASATLVAVVLGTESLDARFATTRALLASAEAGLKFVPLATAGQVFGTYTSASGAAYDAVAADPLSAVVFGDTPVTPTVALDALPTDAAGAVVPAAGTVVGHTTFTVGTATYDVPLTLALSAE
ncbi:D-alanyl-D-alanine carboxypeptidase [Subtercola sp. Z020]|nr:D-alanyl-D-alanine carboxypeptidase [Subtercola sp. Z020]